MRRILSLAFAGIFGILATTSQAQMREIEFEEYDLKNGLHVILHEDHSTPIVAVTVMYHVGSKNEDPSRTGMAHFFEHLLFEGSENMGRGEFSRYVENAGGVLNANTSNDRTFYYEVLPSNQLELGLWLESERMLHAKVENEGIETQREVVKEEKRQRVDNQPYGRLLEETMKRAYVEHPYKWTTIGSMDHLNAAKEEEFVDFYKTFYVPNNAVLSIAGDINIDEAKDLIKKYFSAIPKGTTEIPRPTMDEPMKTAEVRDTILGKDQLPLVLQAYHIPAQGEPDFYSVDMLNTLLSQGGSSRLNRAVVEEKQLALFCGAFSFPLEDPGLTLAFSMANMGVDPAEVEAAMNEEIERVKNELISEEELQKLKNQVENGFVSSNSSVAGIAESLANYHMYYGDANLINNEIERYQAVTREDIQKAAQKYYSENNRVVLYFLFDEEAANATEN
ncbi:M16 family metallopeptidase [Sanyastnella coralliicola]|uniref:M16 family metallopeptidase n=1 Tax=Sanyastnella coralliicola TaxID=3069118 RepID=UPI0027BA288D|nr:pitrilysin family protein [Longitalea sp. SCSIO 12813]